MPKAKKPKYYAVRKGREGPKIYYTWEEAKENISRYPGAIHKSFTMLKDAEIWLASYINMASNHAEYRAPLVQSSTQIPNVNPRFTAKMKMKAKALSREMSFSSTSSSASTCSSSSSTPEPPPSHVLASDEDESIVLSDEQRDVLELVKEGQSVFFTGPAGTGKSFLLRQIIKYCRNGYAIGGDNSLIAVTAPTGIAAVHVGGATIHSWAGIGLGIDTVQKIYHKHLGYNMKQGKKGSESKVVARWCHVRTLIIDEISMLDGALFDKLEELARLFRNNSAPFGGIQLVLCGDFYQLPPVPGEIKGVKIPATFAFEAKTWSSCVGKPIILRNVFRQKDQIFVNMLNALRLGSLDPESIAEFKKLSRHVIYDDGIEPTDLFPTRKEVEAANANRLNRLDDPGHVYNAEDYPGFDEDNVRTPIARMEKLLDRLVAPKKIHLKIGAQVMLIKNLIQGELVNGSVGKVIAFSTARDAVQQGAEIARTKKDAKTSDNPENEADEISEDILHGSVPYPVVEFSSGRRYLCVPASFEVNNVDGNVEARREQIPLILAWALSIHKSQGQTLERVRVNLGQIFEKGQAYVALSRATSMETLEVQDFDPAKVMAHPRVLRWMREHTIVDNSGNGNSDYDDNTNGDNANGDGDDNAIRYSEVIGSSDVDDDLAFWDES